MKRFLYIISVLSLFICIETYAQRSINDQTLKKMKVLSNEYLKAEDKNEMKTILANMNELDKKIKNDASDKIWDKLDKKNASAGDYRRVGLTLLATNYKEQAKWCFYKGATLGDPCCINYVLVDMLKSEQDPLVVLEIIEYMTNVTYVPLLHNMALALSQIDNEDCQKNALLLAKSYFSLVDDKIYVVEIRDLSEYIDYKENEWLKMTKQSWATPYDKKSIGVTLRKYYESKTSLTNR